MRVKLSDETLHRQLGPTKPIARAVVDMLEQFRVESLANPAWPGVRANRQHRFERWTLGFHHSGLTDTTRGLRLFTVAQIARSRVICQPPLEAIEPLMEATRHGIAPLLGQSLAGLRCHRDELAAYAAPARRIAATVARRLFRQARAEPQADCALGFLIDCSGSMRQHIEAVAILEDVFARALDLAGVAGVASEVLGFSTGAWQGGRAARDWQRADKPPQPGRLNETAQLVVKDADTAWRHARCGIAALLRAELLREGVDREARAWAAARLRARPERRRLLVVISDGCPMDGTAPPPRPTTTPAWTTPCNRRPPGSKPPAMSSSPPSVSGWISAPTTAAARRWTWPRAWATGSSTR